MLNAIGIQNIGAEAFVCEINFPNCFAFPGSARHRQSLCLRRRRSSANWPRFLAAAEGHGGPGSEHILSQCTLRGACFSARSQDMAAKVARPSVKKNAGNLPVIIKLSPNVADIASIAKAVSGCRSGYDLLHQHPHRHGRGPCVRANPGWPTSSAACPAPRSSPWLCGCVLSGLPALWIFRSSAWAASPAPRMCWNSFWVWVRMPWQVGDSQFLPSGFLLPAGAANWQLSWTNSKHSGSGQSARYAASAVNSGLLLGSHPDFQASALFPGRLADLHPCFASCFPPYYLSYFPLSVPDTVRRSGKTALCRIAGFQRYRPLERKGGCPLSAVPRNTTVRVAAYGYAYRTGSRRSPFRECRSCPLSCHSLPWAAPVRDGKCVRPRPVHPHPPQARTECRTAHLV